jgi:HSP20 family protein
MITKTRNWRPPTDVYESDDCIIVKVEIAGMDQEKFDITYFKNTLNISGCRSDENSSIKAFHQLEIGYGEFLTSVEIGVPIQVDKSEAIYQKGFLIISLPKSHPKNILIK